MHPPSARKRKRGGRAVDVKEDVVRLDVTVNVVQVRVDVVDGLKGASMHEICTHLGGGNHLFEYLGPICGQMVEQKPVGHTRRRLNALPP